MRHRNAIKKLKRPAAHRGLLKKNFASSLILYEKITTTRGKAKGIAPYVERVIARSKKSPEDTRHILQELLGNRNAAKKVREVLVPRYQHRSGGYTRIVRLERRRGDQADMVQLELMQAYEGTKAKATK